MEEREMERVRERKSRAGTEPKLLDKNLNESVEKFDLVLLLVKAEAETEADSISVVILGWKVIFSSVVSLLFLLPNRKPCPQTLAGR